VLENKQKESGLGMGVSIVRVPACLEMNFNLLEELSRNEVFDYYEVKNSNTEIVMYWRQFMPGETKIFNIDMLQRYSGECYEKPHTAYLYYDDD